jgi:hypothetical protein
VSDRLDMNKNMFLTHDNDGYPKPSNKNHYIPIKNPTNITKSALKTGKNQKYQNVAEFNKNLMQGKPGSFKIPKEIAFDDLEHSEDILQYTDSQSAKPNINTQILQNANNYIKRNYGEEHGLHTGVRKSQENSGILRGKAKSDQIKKTRYQDL